MWTAGLSLYCAASDIENSTQYLATSSRSDATTPPYGPIELYILLSELSRHKLLPTLANAHYSCPDNTTGLVAGAGGERGGTGPPNRG